MLRSLKNLEGFGVRGSDGDIGKVQDFYFDDESWGIRYLVVELGGFWTAVNRVLISPAALVQADWLTRTIQLALTRAKIEQSPSVDLDKPVSRQFEQEYSRYYGWPTYWGSDGLWGQWNYPQDLAKGSFQEPTEEESLGDPHLRSLREALGYHAHGVDGEVGHLDDVIADDETWSIRYLVIATSNWGLGKKVLIAPSWIERISWADSELLLTLPCAAIESSPVWSPDQAVNREYETRLYDYYGRPVYWLNEEHPQEVPKIP